jgi:hypothetical protein
VAAPYTEEQVFDLIADLAEHGAVGGVARDLKSGSVTLTVDAPSSLDAASIASKLVTDTAARTLGSDLDIVGLDVMSEEAAELELARPVYPEVVGYAEIADMAHVSRQAARAWADNPTFPPAVIETAQGPLRAKDAVQSWLDSRSTRRRRSLANA